MPKAKIKGKKIIKKAKSGDGRIGNQFWRLRAKHGRDKLFETPEMLWDAACEYFNWFPNTHPIKNILEVNQHRSL